jgi:hypothetical protein
MRLLGEEIKRDPADPQKPILSLSTTTPLCPDGLITRFVQKRFARKV